MKLFVFVLLFCSKSFAYDYSHLIKKYSDKYNIEHDLIEAVIAVESGFKPKAVNKDGSYGLMQIQLGTAKVMGHNGDAIDLLRPEINISIGVKYLRYLLDMFKDENMALDAYNRGWGNVKKWPYKGDWNKHKYVGLVIRKREQVSN